MWNHDLLWCSTRGVSVGREGMWGLLKSGVDRWDWRRWACVASFGIAATLFLGACSTGSDLPSAEPTRALQTSPAPLVVGPGSPTETLPTSPATRLPSATPTLAPTATPTPAPRSDRDAYANRDADSDSDAYRDTHTDSNASPYCNTYPNPDACSDRDANADANALADIHAATNLHGHPHALPHSPSVRAS